MRGGKRRVREARNGRREEHVVLSAPFLAMFAVSHEHRIQPDAQWEGLGAGC